MSIDIRYPNITSATDKGQLEQIRAYLYQLVDQLKWALNTIDSGDKNVVQQGRQAAKAKSSEEDAIATFNSIKSLIIKSADIVEAYSEEISKRLSGEYVAQSDFGTYVASTTQIMTADSENAESLYQSIQEIFTDIENLEHSLIEANAHIKSGILYYGENEAPVYGLEIGQINHLDGKEVFNKYARFTSDRLSFYDKNDTEVAYISDYKLHITNVHITGTLTLGRFEYDTSDGIAIKWV